MHPDNTICSIIPFADLASALPRHVSDCVSVDICARDDASVFVGEERAAVISSETREARLQVSRTFASRDALRDEVEMYNVAVVRTTRLITLVCRSRHR
jgi:hypothetical protein